jgi:hypothetical protein
MVQLYLLKPNVAGVKVYPRQTLNFRSHAVSTCIGLRHHRLMHAPQMLMYACTACIAPWYHRPMHAVTAWALLFWFCLGYTFISNYFGWNPRKSSILKNYDHICYNAPGGKKFRRNCWVTSYRHLRHHDIQHNDTQHNDIQHNDTQHKGLICDTQHKCCENFIKFSCRFSRNSKIRPCEPCRRVWFYQTDRQRS